MRAHKRITPEIAEEIKVLYQQGIGAPRISRKLEVGETTVYKLLKKVSIRVRSRFEARAKVTSKMVRQIISLYQGGWSTTRIAEKLRISPEP